MTSNLLRSGECKREVTEKSSYLNRTGSVFYIGRHFFFDGYHTLDDAPASSKRKQTDLEDDANEECSNTSEGLLVS